MNTRTAARVSALALCGIVLLGAGLRLWHLATLPPGLFSDEAVNGVDARMVLSGAGLPLYFAANYGREPLFIYLQTLSVALLGYRPIALRIVPAVIGILTIPAVYFCARAILTGDGTPEPATLRGADEPRAALAIPWRALLAAAGLAVSYWSLSLSRLGLRAVMVPLTSALAMGCFWLAWNGRRRLYAWAGFWFGLGLYTYTAARALLLVPVAFAVVEGALALARRRTAAPGELGPAWRRRLAGLAMTGATCLVLALPLAAAAWQDPNLVVGRTDQVSLLAAPPLGEAPASPLQRLAHNALLVARDFYDHGDLNPRHNLPGRPVNDPLLAVLFTAGCLACLWRIRQPRARLLLGWLVVMLLPTLLSGQAPHSLRAAGALPPLALLYGVGAGALSRALPGERIRRYGVPALLGLVIVISGSLTARDYFVRWAALPQLGEAFSLSAELAAEETARQLDGDLSTGVAGNRVLISDALFTQPQMVFAIGVPQIGLALPEVGPAATSYVLPDRYDPLQPMFLAWRGPGGVQAALLALPKAPDVAALRAGGESGGLGRTVQATNQRAGWPSVVTGPLPEGVTLSRRSIAVPMDVSFAGGLHLLGYEVEPPADNAAAPAPAVWLTTFWRCDPGADQRQMNEAEAFLHLAHAGAVWRTDNHPLPTTTWLAWPHTCTMLIDRQRVAIPSGLPAGKSYFETGLYLPAQLDRIPIVAPSENGSADQVAIAPFMLHDRPPVVSLEDLRPVGAHLDGRLELAAWRTVRVNPGTLRVELAWRSLDRTGTDYTAFVHLIDADGRIIAQHDEPPGGEANPTALWAPGETVRSAFDLSLPAGWQSAGQRLRVGLYLSATGRQAQVTDLPIGSPASDGDVLSSGGSFIVLPLGLQ